MINEKIIKEFNEKLKYEYDSSYHNEYNIEIFYKLYEKLSKKIENAEFQYKRAGYHLENCEIMRTLDEFKLGIYTRISSNINIPTTLFVFFNILYINFVKFNYDYEKESSEWKYNYIAVNPKNHNIIKNEFGLEYNFIGVNYNVGNYVNIKKWNEDKQKVENTLKLIKYLRLKISSTILNFYEDIEVLDTVIKIFFEFLSSKSGTNYEFNKKINFEIGKLKNIKFKKIVLESIENDSRYTRSRLDRIEEQLEMLKAERSEKINF